MGGVYEEWVFWEKMVQGVGRDEWVNRIVHQSDM
jgi:hypothetical protein